MAGYLLCIKYSLDLQKFAFGEISSSLTEVCFHTQGYSDGIMSQRLQDNLFILVTVCSSLFIPFHL